MPQREYLRFSWLRPVAAQVAFFGELVVADVKALSRRLSADPWVATGPVVGVPPLLVLLRQPRSTRGREAMLTCARLLLDAGADPDSYTTSDYGRRESALLTAIESADLELARLLIARGATRDEESFGEACMNDEFSPPDDRPFYDLFIGGVDH